MTLHEAAPAAKPKPTQDPAPQPPHKTYLSQKIKEMLLLKASGLSIVVWHEQERQWISPVLFGLQPMHSMQSQIGAMVNTDLCDVFIRELLAAAVHREAQGPECPKHACFGCAVLLRDRRLCPNDQSSTTACTGCVAFRRPCGQLCERPSDALEKAFAFGFLPLPEEWREGFNYMAFSYYVRAGTMIEPAVPKGKGRNRAVWRWGG